MAEFDRFIIGGKETEVLHARVHKSVVLLTLPGVEDMDAALALKGREVKIYRDDVELPEGEYFDGFRPDGLVKVFSVSFTDGLPLN